MSRDPNRLQRWVAGLPVLQKRLVTGASWTTAGNLGFRALTAISTFLLARLLGPSAFGELNIVQSTVELFAVYAGMRIGDTATRFVAQYRTSDPDYASRVLRLLLLTALVTCTVAAISMVALAPLLAEHVFGRASLTMPVALGGILVFLTLFAAVHEGAIAGLGEFSALARLAVIRGALTLLLVVPAAWFFGVTGAVAALATVAGLNLIQLRGRLKRSSMPSGIRLDRSIAELKGVSHVLWKFALPGMLLGTLNTGGYWLCKTILARQASGMVELGLFAAANSLRLLVLFVPAMLLRVSLPILAEAGARGGREEFEEAARLSGSLIAAVCVPASILLIGLAHPIAIIFGPGFEAVEQLVPVAMLSVLLFAFNQSLGKVIESRRTLWPQMYMRTFWTLPLIGTCLWLAPQLGAMAIALALVVSEFCLLTVQIAYVASRISIRVARQNLGWIVAGTTVTCLAVAARLLLDPRFGDGVVALLLAATMIPLISAARRLTR